MYAQSLLCIFLFQYTSFYSLLLYSYLYNNSLEGVLKLSWKPAQNHAVSNRHSTVYFRWKKMVLARSRVIILLLLLKLFLAHLTVVHTIYRILRKNNKFIFPRFHTRWPTRNTRLINEIKKHLIWRPVFRGKTMVMNWI